MARPSTDAELDQLLQDHFLDRRAEILAAASSTHEVAELLDRGGGRAVVRLRWDMVLVLAAAIALAGTASLLVGAGLPRTMSDPALVVGPSPSLPSLTVDLPTLDPCPTGSSVPCVDHGRAAVQLWRGDGTMSGPSYGLLDVSLGTEEDPFTTIVYGDPSGERLRITARRTSGPMIQMNIPGTGVEFEGAHLGPRASQAASGCVVTISAIPPAGPLQGMFACGDTPWRGGSGTSGDFEASASQGVLVMWGLGPMIEASLVPDEGLDPATRDRLDLVYEAPWPDWAGQGDGTPEARVEIRASLEPDGTVAAARVTWTGRYLAQGPRELQDCSMRVDARQGTGRGSFHCEIEPTPDDPWPAGPIDGTFTFLR